MAKRPILGNRNGRRLGIRLGSRRNNLSDRRPLAPRRQERRANRKFDNGNKFSGRRFNDDRLGKRQGRFGDRFDRGDRVDRGRGFRRNNKFDGQRNFSGGRRSFDDNRRGFRGGRFRGGNNFRGRNNFNNNNRGGKRPNKNERLDQELERYMSRNQDSVKNNLDAQLENYKKQGESAQN